jgi:hypothetical protein
MQSNKHSNRVLSIVLVLLVFLILSATAQDECPPPRVKVSNDMDYYNMQDRNNTEHNILSLNTAVANNIIARNAGDIRFFSAFTAAIPVGDMDYYLTVGSSPTDLGAQVLIKLVDNKNRVVLNATKAVNDALWTENTIDIARSIASEVSPLMDKIKDHQHRIRNTTQAAISSKFELEQRSYHVKLKEEKSVTFILKDCDGIVLPHRGVLLELEGKGKIDRAGWIVDEDGMGEFVYTAPEDNEHAKVILSHRYEDVAGNENIVSVDAVDFNTSGKLWLLVNYVTERAEIYIVGEHIGALEMNWNSDNTRGGSIAAIRADVNKELWSTYLVGYFEMTVTPAGDHLWTTSNSWFPGPTKITDRKTGGYDIEILWPMENGGALPVHGTITMEKPALFDQARRKYLAAKRGR